MESDSVLGQQMNAFYEFFSGGGMARAGLGAGWECLLANDLDQKKAASYAANWGKDHLVVRDVAELTRADLPGRADLAWASFPCQDLSLAGSGAGLSGDRSGTFWPFWRLIAGLKDEGRAPQLIALENVCGALNSHGGEDFAAICEALESAGYLVGAIVANAVDFVPQSRPRLFIIGARKESIPLVEALSTVEPDDKWHPPSLRQAYDKLSWKAKGAWVWWKLPAPPARNTVFADLVEEQPKRVQWHTAEETQRLLNMMSPVNLAKVEVARETGRRMVGTIYKRTRLTGKDGEKIQRAEIRFDDVAGCLRTPSGGSSRQTIMVVEGKSVRSRLLSPREAARLMGLDDDYILPDSYNEAYHLAGDGVAVPVVRFLAENIFEPLLSAVRENSGKAAA